MRIKTLSVKNYRSLRDITIEMDDYTALVGPNGAGKSSLLYALQWFMGEGDMMELDRSKAPDGLVGSDPIEVSVTFRDLTVGDKRRLGEYGRSEFPFFRRTWVGPESGARGKIVGNALQGPGFLNVRQKARIGEMRSAYEALRDGGFDLPELDRLVKAPDILTAIADWEDDPRNQHMLEEVSDSDAHHLFGFNGTNVIRECIQLVLVPAGGDLSSELNGDSRRSTLATLVGGLMASATNLARNRWMDENRAVVTQLNIEIGNSVAGSVAAQTDRINQRLGTMIPNASVAITPTIPAWEPKVDASVATNVTIDGITNSADRQGHGVQRAIMIALLQAFVPDEELVRAQHLSMEGESEEESKLRLQYTLSELPAMVVCIEEPEIYQHPVRARAFARSLAQLALRPEIQVVVATHSPYFVTPDKFSSLRRVVLGEGQSRVTSTSISEISSSAMVPPESVQKYVHKSVSSTFSEGFFANRVVLVEGETDRVVIEAVSDLMGSPLDSAGVTVLDVGGKQSLRIPFEILSAMGVRVYPIVDCDSLSASRRSDAGSSRAAQSHNTHRTQTEAIVSWLPESAAGEVFIGSTPFAFGDRTLVTARYALWQQDIEEELGAWPSFVNALDGSGGRLRADKDLFAYRAAVLEASLSDIPSTISALVEAIGNFAGAASDLDLARA